MSKILYTDNFEYATDGAAQSAYVTNASALELDYMEYANDAAAQAAYVTSSGSGLLDSYGEGNQSTYWNLASDASGSMGGQAFTLAADDQIVSVKFWVKKSAGGSGTYTVELYAATGTVGTDATPTGSVLATVSQNISALTTEYALVEYTFSTPYDATAGDYWVGVKNNNNAATGIVIMGVDNTSPTHGGNGGYYDGSWHTGGDVCFYLYGPAITLQSYSESTIIQQGSYSLKGVAVITDSLNDTLTKTLTDYLDYSIQDKIVFQVRSSRTGENLQLQLHDTGGITSSHTINIASADTWQTETWDISGITTTDRDTIDKLIIKIINADAENTFYFDNLFSEVVIEHSSVWFGG